MCLTAVVSQGDNQHDRTWRLAQRVAASGETVRAELFDGSAPRRGAGRYFDSLKLTVTVMITGTGMPLRRVGVYFHCRTASSAA